MGPYCAFCDRRCFTPLPADTPEYILEAMRARLGKVVDLVATCSRGQAEELAQYGYCWEQIRNALVEIHSLEALHALPVSAATPAPSLIDTLMDILDPHQFKKTGGDL